MVRRINSLVFLLLHPLGGERAAKGEQPTRNSNSPFFAFFSISQWGAENSSRFPEAMFVSLRLDEISGKLLSAPLMVVYVVYPIL